MTRNEFKILKKLNLEYWAFPNSVNNYGISISNVIETLERPV